MVHCVVDTFFQFHKRVCPVMLSHDCNKLLTIATAVVNNS